MTDPAGHRAARLHEAFRSKVVCNASGEDAPFKPDSGIALVAQALRMAAAADDSGFRDHVRGHVARVGWD